MKTLLKSTDRALIENLRIALEAENIAVVVQEASSAALPFLPATVLVPDTEFSKAREIVAELVPAAAAIVVPSAAPSRRIGRGLLLAAVILAIIACGLLW